MIDPRISMLAAATAVATLPLLAACGSNDQPQSAPSTAASQAASQAVSSTAPASEPAATPTSAASSSSAATPSSEPSQETGAVKSASEKFVTSALTLGYPDKSYDTYLARLEPLMTESGFATVKKSAAGSKNLERGIQTLSKNHGRSTPKLTSDVKVSSITADRATTKLGYQLTTQQQAGEKWKTLRTGPKETVTIKLVSQGGKWLIDEAS